MVLELVPGDTGSQRPDKRLQKWGESGRRTESCLFLRRKVFNRTLSPYYRPTIYMQAKDALLHTIHQISDLLGQIAPHEYRQPLPEFDGSTLGQHFRHILEFFICLERGIPSGTVDYASRERNLLLEDSPGVAKDTLENFALTLESIEPATPLDLKAEFGGSERPCYQSTVGRELVFVYDHAIHHLAMIKIGLRCHFPQVQADRDLGVSPSTIKARKAVGI